MPRTFHPAEAEQRIENLESVKKALLEALKGATEPTWHSPMSRFEGRYGEWYSKARAAIALAEKS